MKYLYTLVISPCRTNRVLIGQALAQQGMDSRYLSEGHIESIRAYLDLYLITNKVVPACIVMDEKLGRETIVGLLSLLRQHTISKRAQLLVYGSEGIREASLVNQGESLTESNLKWDRYLGALSEPVC